MNKNIISLLLVLSFSVTQAKDPIKRKLEDVVERRFEESWLEYCDREPKLGRAERTYINKLLTSKEGAQRDFFQKGDTFRGEEGATFKKMKEILEELDRADNSYDSIDELVSAHLGVGVDKVKSLSVGKKVELYSRLMTENIRIVEMHISIITSLLKESNRYDDPALAELHKKLKEKMISELGLYRNEQSVLSELEDFIVH
jgi:hypothetical protein